MPRLVSVAYLFIDYDNYLLIQLVNSDKKAYFRMRLNVVIIG